jgi:hypothetical protein
VPGGKRSRNVVESGDFSLVTREHGKKKKKQSRTVVAKVLKLYPNLVDGLQSLLVQPVSVFLAFPTMSTATCVQPHPVTVGTARQVT